MAVTLWGGGELVCVRLGFLVRVYIFSSVYPQNVNFSCFFY